MGVTISTHNGSAVARDHNIRNPKVVSKEQHIDPNGVHETWIDEPIRQAYQRLFGDSVEAYNAKQKREDRRIDDYYSMICKDKKKHPVYEMIIGIYGKNEDGSPICSAEDGKEIMQHFVGHWKSRNPNLEIIGAYYHADEQGEPHVHIDYIPVAHGYKKGMITQTALVKALGEQGFTKTGKQTAQIKWEARENAYLEKLCNEYGLTVEHPKQEGRQHLETQELKLQSRVIELEKVAEQASERFLIADEQATERELQADKAKQSLQQTEEKLKQAEQRLDEVNTMYDNALKYEQPPKKLLESRQDYEARIATGQQAIAVQQKTSELNKREKDFNQHKKTVSKNLAEREKKIEQKEKELEKARSEEDKRVAELAEKLSKEKVGQALRGVTTTRLQRLEKFCKKFSFNDGTTVLDRFEQEEKRLEEEMLKKALDEPLFSQKEVMSDKYTPTSDKDKTKSKSVYHGR